MSRFGKQDEPTEVDVEQFRLQFEERVLAEGHFTLADLMRLPAGHPCFRRKLSAHEQTYLERLEEHNALAEDLAGCGW